jgi:ABC-type multidrug transport system permease subunit
MKSFISLWIARNKEFYRDKGSLSWAFLFPILIIIGCAIAFSNDDEKLLTIGYYPAETPITQLNSLTQKYTSLIAYNDLTLAKTRLRHHQLHAIVETQSQRIWINPNSTQSHLIQQLLKSQNNAFEIHEISGKAIRYVDWVVPGILAMNIMFGSLFGVGYVLVRYRKNGVLKRLQATPVTAFKFLSAQIASRLFLVVGSNSIIFIGSYFLLDLKMEGSWLNLFIISICGAISMIAMGLLIASRTDSEEFAGGILNAATWPMTFLSGIWFSLDQTPQGMQTFAHLFPLTHLVNASRAIMLEGASLYDVMWPITIMLGIGFICLSLAAALFRWHK